jgi:hypothetical protein
MTTWTLDDIKTYGFKGFKEIADLRRDIKTIPADRGVYLIIKTDRPHKFLKIGTGGHFKGKNPNVDLEVLNHNWVDNSIVVYIGQAGGIRNGNWSNSTLRERLKKYFDFGLGKPVGHWGGRLIWQIENSDKLVVCWKELPDKVKDPCKEESELIEKFKTTFDKRPFANLRD